MSKMKTWAAAAAVAAVASVTGASAFADGEVAQIGATKYSTLKAAFVAATPGDTVTMLSDYELPSALTVPVALTLNLAGHTLNGSKLSDYAFKVAKESGVTSLAISNGSYTASGEAVKGFAYVANAGMLVEFADLALEDNGTGSILYFDNGATGTVSRCTLKGVRRYQGLTLDENTQVTVNDSTIDVNNIAAITAPNLHWRASAIGLDGAGRTKPFNNRPRLFVNGEKTFIKGGMYGVYVQSPGGEATLNGGTYEYYTETNIVIDPGTGNTRSAPVFTDHFNYGAALEGDSAYTNYVYITGGTYKGRVSVSNGQCAIYANGGRYENFEVYTCAMTGVTLAPVVFSGGSFDADPNEWVVEGKVAKKNATSGRWEDFVTAVCFTVEPAEHSSFVAWKNETYGYTNSTNVAEFEAKQYLRKIAVGDQYEVTFAAEDGYLFEDDTLTNVLNGVAGDADFNVAGHATKEAVDPTTKSVEAAKAGDAIVLPSGKQLSEVEILDHGKEMKIGDDSWTKENYVFVKGREDVTVAIDPEKKMVAAIAINGSTVTITTVETVDAFWYAVNQAASVDFKTSVTNGYKVGTGSAQTIELTSEGSQQFFKLSVTDREPETK